MKQIIYASRATRPLSDRDLAELMELSRDRNRRAGITGLLVVHNNSYLQLLEGPTSTVDERFARIEVDPRHTNLRVHVEAEAEERWCPEWSMGLTAPDPAQWQEVIDAVKLPQPPVSLDLIESDVTARVLVEHYVRLVRRGIMVGA